MASSRRRFLRLGRDLAIATTAMSTLGLPGCTRKVSRSGPPNIVLFLVDDLGVSDSSAAGSAFYDTPALERMIREGMVFEDAYSPSPLCSSSRASILTGRYPHRVGITGAITCSPPCTEIDEPALPESAPDWQKSITPSYRTHLPLEERTIAEVLRDAGYATGHVGKWHLGGPEYAPSEQGYDTVVGGTFHWSPASHIAPYGIPELEDAKPGELLEDRLTSEAISFIRRKRHRPFFLGLFHYGVHAPIEAVVDRVDFYESRVDPSDAQRNPEYGSMVEACDRSLGRLLDTLDELGLSEDTLVIMTSDNGGLLYESSHGAIFGVTSNAPYRGGKAHVYEGGTRVPFVARWAGTIAPGSASTIPVSGVDLMATAVAVAGIDRSSLPTLDGVDLLPLLTGAGAPADRALYVHFPHYIPGPRPAGVMVDEQPFWAVPASAMRLGNDKLVRSYGEGPTRGGALGSDRFELFDLSVDPGETRDLSAERPERVLELAAMLEAHLAETGAVVPVANPRFTPSFDGIRILANASATKVGGILRVVATGPDPGLVTANVDFARPVRFVLRLRSASATVLELFYATSTDAGFSQLRRFVSSVPASATFEEISFDVPGSQENAIRRFRIDPGDETADVEFEWAKIVDPNDPSITLRSYPFDSASDGSYGGAFTATGDCTVACSAGALHVQMDGPNPRIASGPVLLFGPIRLRFRLRSTGSGPVFVGYATSSAAADDASSFVAVDVVHDDVYRDYEATLIGPLVEPITRLVVRLGASPGTADLGFIRAMQVTAIGESLVGTWEFGG